jgi:hypothetical protein
LRTWIDADRAGLRTRTRLSESARDWKNSGRDPAYLYTGARLAVAEEWGASHSGELSTEEAEFVRRSLEAQTQREATELEAAQRLARAEAERAKEAEKRAKEQREAANKLRRRAVVATGAAAAAVILLATSVFMWLGAQEQARIAAVQRSQAEEQAEIAKVQRLAAQSSALVQQYPQRSLLLAVEAVRAGESIHGTRILAAEQSLREALSLVGGRPIMRREAETIAVGMSPHNHWLVTGSWETMRLWDLTTKDPSAKPVVLRGHEDVVNAVAISADSHWLVTGSQDRTARLWGLTSKSQSRSSRDRPRSSKMVFRDM